MRILLAEDEHELGDWLVRALGQSGFQVDWINDGRLVRHSLKATRYDALILDLGLPGLGGHEVLEYLRQADQRLPVLILTARDSLMERVNCLHQGADDFLAKPFEVTELEARLVALIRRARGSDQPRFACGPLSYDASSKQFRLGHDALVLTTGTGRCHAVDAGDCLGAAPAGAPATRPRNTPRCKPSRHSWTKPCAKPTRCCRWRVPTARRWCWNRPTWWRWRAR